MTQPYTNLFDVMNDVSLYLGDRFGDDLTLALLPSIARNRWPWLVQNYQKLRPAFVTAVDGSGPLEQALVELDRQVDTWNLGNRQNPFDDTNRVVDFSNFLNLIKLQQIGLSPAEQQLLGEQQERVRAFTVETFQQMVDLVDRKTAEAADVIGLGDATVDATLGRQPLKQQRDANISDLEQIEQALEIQDIILQIISDMNRTGQKPPDLLTFDQQSIDPNSNVTLAADFLSYKIVPFEISLEHMADKYMGDQNLWYELLTVNNLQPPYVDEAGVKWPLLASATTNNVTIDQGALTNVPVGTKISIGSFRIKEETRIVERSLDNPNGTVTLFLSGDPNMARLTLADQAFIRVFAPGTARKGQFVFIPLKAAAGMQTPPTPSSDALRRLGLQLLSFGIDFARDERTNDIILEKNQDIKAAAGLANVRQAVLYALRTIQGELPEHPDYGVSLDIGGRFFGTTDEALLFGEQLRNTLLHDNRFQDVKIAKLGVTGTSISLSLLVFIRGSDDPLPLSFVS